MKFNNLGLAQYFYTTVTKKLKVKVRQFLGLSPKFVEVTEEKLVGGGLFALPPSPPPYPK